MKSVDTILLGINERISGVSMLATPVPDQKEVAPWLTGIFFNQKICGFITGHFLGLLNLQPFSPHLVPRPPSFYNQQDLAYLSFRMNNFTRSLQIESICPS